MSFYFPRTLRSGSETLTIPQGHVLHVATGRLIFDLLCVGDGVGITEGDSPRINELRLPFGEPYSTLTRVTSPQPVPLRPEDRVFIGRRSGELTTEGIDRGVVIYGSDGEFDDKRTELLADRVLQFAIRADNRISRAHAEITINEERAVTVRDLGSSNGTMLNLQAAPPNRSLVY
ncbi:MAG TPA: FHA domain-containing protein [Candidatus Saccharimonadales bacterium]|nr:FHA domain-containing protein [Candidatus Saccharimonadales bacterium]